LEKFVLGSGLEVVESLQDSLVGWVADGWDSVVLNGFDRFGDDSGRGQLKMEA